MTFEVVEGGPLTTVQDLGRHGLGAYGVPDGGALDRGAHARANALVGNPAGSPTLEFTLVGPRLRWMGGSQVGCALVGDAEEVRVVRPGAVLDCGRLLTRARGYLAVPGGFQAQSVLGSAATSLAGALGGHLGRGLRRGDRLDLQAVAAPAGAGEVARPTSLAPPPPAVVLRVLPGPGGVTPRALLASTWTALSGDRAGVRLDGARLAAAPLERSLPLVPGAVEATAGGTPLLLLREHPTVGGYPVVAVVIEADLDAAAQLRPGTRVRFAAVSEAEAVEARSALA